MKINQKIKALCVGSALALSGTMVAENPFLSDYNTPFNIPPFEKITEDDYLPAIKEGIAQRNQEIEAIINNRALPDFDNTVVAFDNAGQLLENVMYAFNGVYETLQTPHMQEVGGEIFPLMAAHSDEIMMNDRLFARFREVYDNQAKFNLTKPQKRLLEKYYKSFVRSGALLTPEQKAELKKINEQLASLNLAFGNNIVKDTNKWKLVVDKKEDLSGLPASSIAVAAEEAEAMGLKGKCMDRADSRS